MIVFLSDFFRVLDQCHNQIRIDDELKNILKSEEKVRKRKSVLFLPLDYQKGPLNFRSFIYETM